MTSIASSIPEYRLWHDATWEKVEAVLRPNAVKFVHTLDVPFWRGQEGEVIKDAVQEAIRRTLERAMKSERGEAPPIDSLEDMAVIILRNYLVDLRRQDLKLVHMFDEEQFSEAMVVDMNESSEAAVEAVSDREVFRAVAHEVAEFPKKQRAALLSDLADRMAFSKDGEEETPLQEAFLEVGIRLEEYKGRLPSDSTSRARHAALMSLAYKRLRTSPRIIQDLKVG